MAKVGKEGILHQDSLPVRQNQPPDIRAEVDVQLGPIRVPPLISKNVPYTKAYGNLRWMVLPLVN